MTSSVNYLVDKSPNILRTMVYAMVLLVPLAFLPKETVLIEAEISFVAIPKVTIFRILTTLCIPFIVLLLIKDPPKLNAIFITVTLFTFWYFVATIFSQNPQISYWGEFFGQDSYSSLATLHYYTAFLAVVLGFRNSEHIDQLLLAIVLSGTLSSIVIILQILRIFPLDLIPSGLGVERPPGTFGNPVFAGAFLSLTSMCTIYLAIYRWKLQKHLLLLAVLLGLQLSALIFTETRASYLAVGVFALSFSSYYIVKYRSLKLLLALSVFFACFIAVAASFGGIQRFTQTPEELTSRIRYWYIATELVSIKPIHGLGPDTFRYFHLAISPATETGLPEEPNHAHSWYFHHLAETGYVGAALATAVTSIPVVVAPTLAPIFLGRSTEQLLSVGRISDISLMFIILGVAYHESRFTFYTILRNIIWTSINLLRKLRSFS